MRLFFLSLLSWCILMQGTLIKFKTNDFELKIAKHDQDHVENDHIWFLMAYNAVFCKRCKRIYPYWEAFAEEYQGRGFKIGFLDCNYDHESCLRFHIRETDRPHWVILEKKKAFYF